MSTFKTENNNQFFYLIWFLLEARRPILGSGVLLSSDLVQNQIQIPSKITRDYMYGTCAYLQRAWNVSERLRMRILLCAWERNLMHFRSIAVVMHRQVTCQAHVHWAHHTRDGVELAGWVTPRTGDRAGVKPCQLGRNLPGGRLAGFTLW